MNTNSKLVFAAFVSIVGSALLGAGLNQDDSASNDVVLTAGGVILFVGGFLIFMAALTAAGETAGSPLGVGVILLFIGALTRSVSDATWAYVLGYGALIGGLAVLSWYSWRTKQLAAAKADTADTAD